MGIRVDGSSLSCNVCGKLVYPDVVVLANHTITGLPDGRCQWYSRDFDRIVHLCDLDALAAAAVTEAERTLISAS